MCRRSHSNHQFNGVVVHCHGALASGRIQHTDGCEWRARSRWRCYDSALDVQRGRHQIACQRTHLLSWPATQCGRMAPALSQPLVSSASFSLYLSVPAVARALTMPLNTRHPQVILEGVSVPDRGGGTPSLLGPYLADLYLTDSDPTTRSPYSPNPSSPPLPLPSPLPPSSSNHHRHHCRHRPRHLC